MSMMNGSGPFGLHPAGYFHPQLPAHIPQIYLETTPKRIRLQVGDEIVADSRHARLLLQRGEVPVYCLPRGDVNLRLLVETDDSMERPLLGPALHYDLQAAGRRIERAAWTHRQPPAHMRDLADLVAFRWDAIDRWFEEEDQVFYHPRDPYHRVDVRQASLHVRVVARAEVVAESERPRLVFETSLPVRYFLPQEDVRMDLLRRSMTRTGCPYKGEAHYWHLEAAGLEVENAAWSIPEPYLEAQPVAGWISFAPSKVDLEIKGQPAPWL